MNYKIYEKEKDIFFKYVPLRNNTKKSKKNVNFTDSPFSKLNQLNIK